MPHAFLTISILLILATIAAVPAYGTPADPKPAVTGLPVIEITTKDSADIASKKIYTYMTFTLTNPNDSTNNILKTDTSDRIRGRGNNSWHDFRARKKSYRVRFNKKTSLFGLEAAKNWVLLAQHRDETLLYNAIAFELGRRFGCRFNHSFNFVDLYINGEYKGNYLLTEHNQAGAGRVDIDRKEGWLVELDEYYDKEPKFRTTAYNLPVMIKSPRFGRVAGSAADTVYDFVRNDLNALTSALASPNFPDSGGYGVLTDINTFVDFLMINEIVANTDLSHPRSTFIYKDKGGALSMGPLWDFDSGYGWNYRNWMESAFNDHFNFPDRRPPVHDFFKRFYEDPLFITIFRSRWNEMYDTIASIPDFIDEMAAKLEKSADLNFQHWWYKTYAPFTNTRFPQPNDFRQAISRLKNWYNARVFYLNAEFNKVSVLPKAGFFTAETVDSRPEVRPRTFTLTAFADYGGGEDEVLALEVNLKKGNSSAFEVSEVADTLLPKITVKPKIAHPSAPAEHGDTLLISGTYQGEPFALAVPLWLVVAENDITPVSSPAKQGEEESAKPRKKRWWRR